MFFIPGFVIAALTFPGVIVHEAAHLLFCRLYRIAVFKVCFFQFRNPAGYVIHAKVEDFKTAWLIAMGPFFVNTGLCILFCSAAFLPVWELKVEDPFAYFFYWLGLSIGMHAFPSTGDITPLWEQLGEQARRFNVLAILSYPLIALVYAGNLLRVVWADLGYGILVGILLPLAAFRALA